MVRLFLCPAGSRLTSCRKATNKRCGKCLERWFRAIHLSSSGHLANAFTLCAYYIRLLDECKPEYSFSTYGTVMMPPVSGAAEGRASPNQGDQGVRADFREYVTLTSCVKVSCTATVSIVGCIYLVLRGSRLAFARPAYALHAAGVGPTAPVGGLVKMQVAPILVRLPPPRYE